MNFPLFDGPLRRQARRYALVIRHVRRNRSQSAYKKMKLIPAKKGVSDILRHSSSSNFNSMPPMSPSSLIVPFKSPLAPQLLDPLAKSKSGSLRHLGPASYWSDADKWQSSVSTTRQVLFLKAINFSSQHLQGVAFNMAPHSCKM